MLETEYILAATETRFGSKLCGISLGGLMPHGVLPKTLRKEVRNDAYQKKDRGNV